jgi:hypothetical protein
MNEQEDESLTKLLRRHEPPARDPLFRVQVLERRERRRFRKQLWMVLSAVVVVATIAAVGAYAGGALEGAARVALFGIAAGTASVAYARAVGVLSGAFGSDVGSASKRRTGGD